MPPSTALITGASGFVGSAVARMALARGMAVRAMVRESSRLDLLRGVPAEAIVRGDMSDAAALASAVQGAAAVVHCAATTSEMAPDLALSRRINVEGTETLLAACRKAGVRRFINISSQSAHADNPSVYGRTKTEQDERVRAAPGVDWTILKPSIIYGGEAKGIFAKMVRLCRRLPVIPIIGPGHEEMRPIHVDDVAWAVLACLQEPRTIGRTYDLGGADVVEFNDFVGEILKALGRQAFRFHLPIPVALAAAKTLSLVMKNPPLTPDNVTGIQRVRRVDIGDAERDFGFHPRSFAQGLRQSLSPEPGQGEGFS